MGFNHMSSIIALRQREHETKKKLQGILDKAQADGRDGVLTEAESAEYETFLTKLKSQTEAVDRELKLMDIERNTAPIQDPDAAAAGGAYAEKRIARPIGKEAAKFTSLFGTRSLTRGGFESFGEFLKILNSGRFDGRMMAAAGSESVPSGGGFFVPDQFAAEMLDASLENEIVRPRARVVPMKSQTMKVAGFDSLDHSGGLLFGGLAAVWMNELGPGTFQIPKTRMITLTCGKLGIFSQQSNELIADGGDFEAMLSSALISAMGWFIDSACLIGDGAGKPLGVLNAPCLITIAKEGSQPANTIVFQNVSKMFGALHPACVQNSCWVANPTILPQLLQLQSIVKNVAGTENVGGSAVPILETDGDTFRMLTRPVIFTEKLPALGSAGQLLLADFSQYTIGLRREITLEKSLAPGFQTDAATYRALCRMDGQPTWNRAFLPKNGTALGPFVALAA
jgi:HK97 family phage major capsid protein